MKRSVIGFLMGFIVFVLSSCNQRVSTNDITINIGKSNQFTEEEIGEAIECVKDNFSFPACTLTKVWYDEETSDAYVKRYLENGKGTVNKVNPENVIVLLSDFDVDGSGDNPVLNPNSTYNDFMWILIRDSKTSSWQLDDWGY